MSHYPITHLGDVRLPGRHRVHAALSSDQRRDTRPVLGLALTGPNGSIAGVGPKAWPLLNPRRNGAWSSSIHVPLPYMTWAVQRRLPRRLGQPIARVQSRAYRSLYAALRDRSNRLCREAQAAQFRGLA